MLRQTELISYDKVVMRSFWSESLIVIELDHAVTLNLLTHIHHSIANIYNVNRGTSLYTCICLVHSY